MAEREKPSVDIWARLLLALKRLETKKYFDSFAPSYLSDEQWVKINHPNLMREFVDCWIVVCQEKVIFTHKSRTEVDKFLADKGYTPKDVVISYITNRMPFFSWTV